MPFPGRTLPGSLRLFASLCFALNTIGAIGDVWIVLKILPHPRDRVFQDTKTGVEVWLGS